MMPFPFAAVGAALAGGSLLVNALRRPPDFPVSEADVNRLIDLQMNRALSQAAGDTRRRLAGAGLEGSGAIDARIADAQASIRNAFEEQRQRALNMVRQQQYQADLFDFSRTSQLLSGLTSAGFQTANFATQGFGQFSNQQNVDMTGIGLAPLPDYSSYTDMKAPQLQLGLGGQ
jgi:hypothetical protein